MEITKLGCHVQVRLAAVLGTHDRIARAMAAAMIVNTVAAARLFKATPRACARTVARSSASNGRIVFASSSSRFPSVPRTSHVLSRA
jgi:hypothetical protein